jgi:uncharacterized protein (TIGR02611 family)
VTPPGQPTLRRGLSAAGARLRAVRDRLYATRGGRALVKVAVALVGGLVVVVGLVLVPLPGPGWLVVSAGVAVLALEFAWARRLLRILRRRLERGRSWFAGLRLRVRVPLIGAAVAVVAAAVWLSVRYSIWSIG